MPTLMGAMVGCMAVVTTKFNVSSLVGVIELNHSLLDDGYRSRNAEPNNY